MKEAYAVRRTVPPSAEIEARIERMLSVGVGESPRESLSELARLGARLIIQRAVEDEFGAWLGRARYERWPRTPSSWGSSCRTWQRSRRPRAPANTAPPPRAATAAVDLAEHCVLLPSCRSDRPAGPGNVVREG